MTPLIAGSNIDITNMLSMGAEGTFYLVTLVFLFFTLSFAYHWFAYGTNKARAITMLTLYLIVSMFLFAGMALSLSAM